MCKELLWGSVKLLLQARLWMEIQSSQSLSVPLLHWGSEPGWDGCSLKDWEPPACQTKELQHPKLSVEGKGLGTVFEVAMGPTHSWDRS
jgi:hypothetical protein